MPCGGRGEEEEEEESEEEEEMDTENKPVRMVSKGVKGIKSC